MSRTPLQWHTVHPNGWYLDGRRRVSDDENQRLSSPSNNLYSTGQQPPQFLLPESRGFDPTMISPSQPRTTVYERPRESAAEPGVTFSSGSTSSMAQHCVQRSNLYSSSSTTFPSPAHSDNSMAIYPQNVPFAKQQQLPPPPPQQPPKRHSSSSMPIGFEKLLNHSPSPPPPPLPPPRRPSSSSRYRLHIRQQPLAARACGAGDRDRRPVDPPPIIQMLLTDFDSKSDTDSDILQDPRFAVGCLLVPVSTSSDLDAEPGLRDDHPAQRDPAGGGGGGQTTPLLSGKAFVSPFYVDADPDPDTAPVHPSSSITESLYKTSTSTTTSAPFILPNPNPPSKTEIPATFYIFSDLSVRTAGLYRLQFRLMNWGSVEDTGKSMPILAETWSDPFRVFPAKDFPGMRDSSALTRGLKEMGFVELKTRGRGEGKGRRPR
ncbi:velvet factor family protein [Aspergillus affinis]|uniref:velvet factor family protein n=1 Tax=Aspergillus affinis TaxID=1070780 RepID=UPI0022FDF164|nr:uncharacterized protein KD926_011493 [Aspergillus affinis]KAI9037881.1 hypothetical protein KD926_011493 [Aspergillus affinis]